MSPPTGHKDSSSSSGEKKSTAKPEVKHEQPDHSKHPAAPQKPDWRRESEPQPAPQAPAAQSQEQEPSKPRAAAAIEPLAAPTPPAGFTQTRTLTIAVYTSTGKAPMYYLNEGSYSAFHGGAENVAVDVRNRLSPPPAAVGAG